MSLEACAAAAVQIFPASTMITTPDGVFPLQVVMVAIGGSENPGWGNAPGDPLSIYRDGGIAERPYSCGGYTSFGTWQANLPAHSAMVASLSGIAASNPCGQATWLADYPNCAKAALAIYRSQGLGAWSTWGNQYTPYPPGYGPYRKYLTQAQAAVTAAAGVSQPPTPSPAPVGQRSPWAIAGALGLLAVVGTTAGLFARKASLRRQGR